MADQRDVRRLALALPDTIEDDGRFGFAVRQSGKGKPKSIVWAWLERLDPKKARVPSAHVVAIRVVDESEKMMLVEADPDKFFTEAHYNGYPAVLVRLAAIGVEELAELITDAWRCQAPKKLVAEFDRSPPASMTAPVKLKPRKAAKGQPR